MEHTTEGTDVNTHNPTSGDTLKAGNNKEGPTVKLTSADREEIIKLNEQIRKEIQNYKEEIERLSLFNKSGHSKSHDEIYRIGLEKQWELVAEWLDRKFGVGQLEWSGIILFDETIKRLDDMNFKLIHSSINQHGTMGLYTFKFNCKADVVLNC